MIILAHLARRSFSSVGVTRALLWIGAVGCTSAAPHAFVTTSPGPTIAVGDSCAQALSESASAVTEVLRQPPSLWRQTPEADSLIREAERKGRIVIQLSWAPSVGPGSAYGHAHARVERVLWGGDAAAAQVAQDQIESITFGPSWSRNECPRWTTQVLVWPTDEFQRIHDDMVKRAIQLREREQADSAHRSRPPA